MKMLIAIWAVLMLCSAGAVLGVERPCYYKIVASGSVSCEDDPECGTGCNYANPDFGCAIYRIEDGYFLPIGDGIEDWAASVGLEYIGAGFIALELGKCELHGFGQTEYDPNFFDCDSDTDGTIVIDIDEYYNVFCPEIDCGGVSFSITRLCDCDALLQSINGCEMGGNDLL